MIQEIQESVNDYWAWLKDKTTLKDGGDWIAITSPYLDRHNDYLQIYAEKTNDGFRLTDDGYILNDLIQSGCNVESQKRKELIQTTLNGFGVQLEESALQVSASKSNFALKKHSLIQAMLAVNDLFYLASSSVTSLFFEDVVTWLDGNEIRYTSNVKIAGKSGYDHRFDFVVPKSITKPERIIQTVNRPNRNAAEVLAFSWIDTKEVRYADTRAYAIVNDVDNTATKEVLEAMRIYEVEPICWSMREDSLEDLVA